MKELLEKKMKELRLTQVAMARKIGISQATVNNILSGADNIREDVRYKIAVAFGLDPAGFILHEPPAVYNVSNNLTEDEKRLLAAFRDLDNKAKQRKLEDIEELAALSKSEKETEKKTPAANSHKLKGGGQLEVI